MSQQVCCIICQSFPQEPCALPSPRFALNFLCKIFRLPQIEPSLLQKLNKTSGNRCKLCKTCGEMIQDAMQIEKEIKKLELKVRSIKDVLWNCITSAQNSSRRIQNDEIPPSVRAVRKYFIQCLGKCEVRLTRLRHDELKGYVKTEVLEKVPSKEIINDVQDDLVIVPFYEENSVSPDNCGQANFDAQTSVGSAGELDDAQTSLPDPSGADGHSVEDDFSDEFKTEEDSEELDSIEIPSASPVEELDQPSAPSINPTSPEQGAFLTPSEASVLLLPPKSNVPPPPAEATAPILAQRTTSSVCVTPGTEEPTKERSPSRLASPKSEKRPKRKYGKYRQIKQPDEDRRYVSKCKYCGLTYDDYRQSSRVEVATSDKMLGNSSINNPQYSYVCDPSVCCDRRYATLRKFRGHHRQRCRENPFVLKDKVSRIVPCHRCDECNKLYTSAASLRRHVAEFHEKNYQFCCEVCGATFLHAFELDRHVIKHSVEKPFKCDQCESSYTRADKLRQHKRTHTGELPYICEICGKGFYKQHCLPLHLENVHGEAKYPCDICGKMFRSKLYVSFHKKNVHGIKRTGGTKSQQDNCDDVLS